MKIMGEKKLIGKDKYIVKVVNQPHRKLVGRLKDKSTKITYHHNNQLRDTQSNQTQNMRKTIIMKGAQ